MRSRVLAVPAVMLTAAAVTASCATETTALRQIRPNAVVYIDGWDEDGDRGDQALVEQKPSGMWVLPSNAPFRTRRGNGFTVQVRLDPARGFVVTDLGGVRVGKDHDDCLAEGETYAFMAVPQNSLRWEPAAGKADGSNDDCEVTPPA